MKTRQANGTRSRWTGMAALAAALVIGVQGTSIAAGTLTPSGSPAQAVQTRSHHVNIIINNGFARTEVTQTFYNPNERDLEGIYSFPLPKSASLAEMTIWAGERELNGEVLPREQADEIYEEEKQKGNDAGKSEKNAYQTFDFYVTPIRAHAETRMRFVYYQPLTLDAGVGRYLYPLESGGTDERAERFWTQNTRVDGQFSVRATVKSAFPLADVRVPGYEAAAGVQKVDDGQYQVDLQLADTQLDRDFVLYYRLVDNLPGRVEVIPYRADPSRPGTFMMVITPGLDLQPLTGGADYIYILDRSGSMSGGKIRTLARGIEKAIGAMRPQDRFRVITFNQSAEELTDGWVSATPENIRRCLQQVARIQADGSTNLHAGMAKALRMLDDDRATSIVLITDGVTNTGLVQPKAFRKLLSTYDVRVFGFVMGNSANWPLMQMIGDLSGGFSVGVSNDDDIIGQIMLAKSKILHESLHDASIDIAGVRVFDTTDRYIGKIYRGQQLVLFGRYEEPGEAVVSLKARLTGEDKTYTSRFSFPEQDEDNPEIERLWALSRIEQYKHGCMLGVFPEVELEAVERELGVKYQLVTDETSMIVLTDEAFTHHGIERRNRNRVARERAAQQQGAGRPVRNYTVNQPQTFPNTTPRPGGGAGAVDPLTALAIVSLGAFGLHRMRTRRSR